jgi:GTP-binding protein HflX
MPELARYLIDLSVRINRQIGVLISRDGAVTHVIVGDTSGIFIPSLEDYPLRMKPLRGLRLIHTHLKDERLTRDDLTDLSLLRLDLIAALGVNDETLGNVHLANLEPEGVDSLVVNLHRPGFDFASFIRNLEDTIQRRRLFDREDMREKAILLSVSRKQKHELEDSIEELGELAGSSDVLVLDRVIQRPGRINPKYLMGIGRLRELVIDALNIGATILIFDQDLSPSQMKAITELTELKVIDRSQLILDVFARRAHSMDGKVQVELAQLKYRLPRLSGKGTAMSRLMGGIGGKGPGEMKLEVDRRRVRERIHLLEKKLKSLAGARKQRKQRRVSRGVPIVSIVGYTNAGKSTLLNALTGSSTLVENKLFATLDTASRRLRLPREREIIITDTVGFIRDLPKDLMAAFRATLEELEDADLLLHLVDASNTRFQQHMVAVEKTLSELGLLRKRCLLVLNKIDRIDRQEAENLERRYAATAISALSNETLGPLLRAVEESLWSEKFALTGV